jgi:hypothetical protein
MISELNLKIELETSLDEGEALDVRHLKKN